MKLTQVSVVSAALSLFAFAGSAMAVDNTPGFQAARQLTSEAMGEKASEGFTGKVLEVIDVQNYTYVQLSRGKDKMWVATTKTPVKKGDMVSFAEGQSMHKFHSKTLNRTFDEIYFANEIEVKR